jgi:hypothetical protein
MTDDYFDKIGASTSGVNTQKDKNDFLCYLLDKQGKELIILKVDILTCEEEIKRLKKVVTNLINIGLIGCGFMFVLGVFFIWMGLS